MRSNHTAAVLVVALPPVELVAPLEWVEQPVEPPPNVHVDWRRGRRRETDERQSITSSIISEKGVLHFLTFDQSIRNAIYLF